MWQYMEVTQVQWLPVSPATPPQGQLAQSEWRKEGFRKLCNTQATYTYFLGVSR